MQQLYADGWPVWNTTLGKTNTLYQLIRHVRNALGHRRVTFSSDSRVLSEVHLHFADRSPGAQQDDGPVPAVGALSAVIGGRDGVPIAPLGMVAAVGSAW